MVERILSRKFSRKSRVARRYDCHPRTVDRRVAKGELPPPYYQGNIPIWADDELDAADRAMPRKRAAGKVSIGVQIWL